MRVAREGVLIPPREAAIARVVLRLGHLPQVILRLQVIPRPRVVALVGAEAEVSAEAGQVVVGKKCLLNYSLNKAVPIF